MTDILWQTIREETACEAQKEPILASFLHSTILNHDTIESALSYHLATKLDCPETPAILLREVMESAFNNDHSIGFAIRQDIRAVYERDSACHAYSTPFLYFKGFLALQAYRIAHWLWKQDRQSLAFYFQFRISVVFGVDIHPAARMGHGIMIDHATGLVIGETCIVGNNVSIMQSVTLGGTGKEEGDRHPKVGDGVLISAGATILGNIKIGEGAKIGAGSVVLQDVPAHTTAAGVPAVIIGKPQASQPALDMNHQISCDMDCTIKPESNT
jgi:serine O-acetyltransferase